MLSSRLRSCWDTAKIDETSCHSLIRYWNALVSVCNAYNIKHWVISLRLSTCIIIMDITYYLQFFVVFGVVFACLWRSVRATALLQHYLGQLHLPILLCGYDVRDFLTYLGITHNFFCNTTSSIGRQNKVTTGLGFFCCEWITSSIFQPLSNNVVGSSAPSGDGTCKRMTNDLSLVLTFTYTVVELHTYFFVTR